MKRKTGRRTIIETRRVTLVVDAASESGLPCEICGSGGDSRLVSPSLAAQIFETDTRSIYRLIESAKIHFVETPTKQLFVCLRSLAETARRMNLDI